MKKKLVSIIIMATFILSSTVVFATSTKISPITNLKSKIQIGDYVQFGHYYGKPILWKCVDKRNGVMLVSEYILCLKAFDAAESGKSGDGNAVKNIYEIYGSNVWKNSNIREWLNSAKSKVSYTTQPPIKEAVRGYNPYADEQGFLYNFSKNEISKIKKIKHDGGIEDSVYLLSMDEIRQYIGDTNEKRIKKITDTGRKKCKFEAENNDYWTRTPSASHLETLYDVRFVDYSGCYDGISSADNGEIGVLPALNVVSDICKSGNGTKTNPYVMN